MSRIVNQALFNAMSLHEKRLGVTTNNLANATTAGYKAVQVSFERHEPGPDELRPPFSSMSSYLDLSGAPLVQTGGRLDLAIEGMGFFVVNTPGGAAYTRDGRFTVDGRKRLVMSGSGEPVMGENGEILIDADDCSVGQDGSVRVNGQTIERLMVVDFEDRTLLQPKGSNLLAYTGNDRGIVATRGYVIRSGYREASNVDVMGEMTDLIDIQRSFEAYDKAKKMAGDSSKALIDILAK